MFKIYSILFIFIITVMFSACTAASDDNNTTTGTDYNVTTDLAPIVANIISDVNASENDANITIDLTSIFTDSDNDDSNITKEVLLNTNPTLLIASISSNLLTIDFLEEQYGESNITIRAFSNGKRVETIFKVVVNEVNIISSGLHILSSSYTKSGSENNTSDDILFIYFDREIIEGTFANEVQDNFDINTTGNIGSASTIPYNRVIFSVAKILLNNNGTPSVVIDTNNSSISIKPNIIKDINGSFADANNEKVKIKEFNWFSRLPTTSNGNFSINGNIVIDKNTGLKWQKEDDNITKSYNDSNNYCNNIQIDGLQNWRLPSLKELLTIVDKGKINPAIDGNFTNTDSLNYYSSKLNDYNVNNAWGVNFNEGRISSMEINSTNFVRCVHDE